MSGSQTLKRIAMGLALSAGLMAQSPPPLPMGLGAPAEDKETGAAPALPPGLGSPAEATVPPPAEEGYKAPLGLTGFWEARVGTRIVGDATQKTASVAETRLQLERDFYTPQAAFRIVGDFVYDAVENDFGPDLERGRGFVDLREANTVFQPAGFLDVKAGRQILTWGVGDLDRKSVV